MQKLGMVVLVVLALTLSVSAQTDIRLKGIGGKLGFIMPEDPLDNTIGFGAVADLGKVSVVRVFGYVDYWRKAYNEGAYWEWSWSVLSLAAVGKYYFESNSDFKPYAGAGLGFDLSMWKSEYTGPNYGYDFGDVEDSDSELDLAIHLLGGASYKLSPNLDGFAEVKYTLGDLDYLGIYAGVIFKLK